MLHCLYEKKKNKKKIEASQFLECPGPVVTTPWEHDNPEKYQDSVYAEEICNAALRSLDVQPLCNQPQAMSIHLHTKPLFS